MAGIVRLLALALLLLAGYLVLWPVPIEPVAWQPAEAPGYQGPHERNERLANMRQLPIGNFVGPEHIAIGPDGWLYTGVLSGEVLRFASDGTGVEVLGNTHGRPLGLDFDASGRLILADAFRGLLALEADGTFTVLADDVGGDPVRYADAVIVAGDGRIYFTDASRRFTPADWNTFEAAVLDLLEHSCTGRVIVYDPASGHASVVIDDLCFPNGLALSGDQRHLFVAETGSYRIWKIDANATGLSAIAALEAQDQTGALVLIDNLPGFPDNLLRGRQGRIWLGFTRPRSAAVDALARWPFLRAVTARLPRSLWPVPPTYGHVIAFDEEGRVVADLQDPGGALPDTTGVTETADTLFIQTLAGSAIGVIDKRSAGID